MTAMTTTTDPTTSTRALLPADRCDTCNAQAFVRVVMTGSGFELLFCGHHFAEAELALSAVSRVDRDDRATLVAAGG